MITRLDRDVAKILQKLKQLGIDEDTLVIFTSDNGPHKEGGADPEFFNSSGLLKGTKRDLYEGGIRVPFIARWPGKIAAGSVSDHPSAFWDFLPTAADIAGVRTLPDIDGISFLPTLLGQPENQKKHDFLYWEFHENETSEQAVRMGNFKAVRHSPQGRVELYDLTADIGEKSDISASHPEIVKKLTACMNAARTPSQYWPLK
jgi:arylsulfatase A-like enzyme